MTKLREEVQRSEVAVSVVADLATLPPNEQREIVAVGLASLGVVCSTSD